MDNKLHMSNGGANTKKDEKSVNSHDAIAPLMAIWLPSISWRLREKSESNRAVRNEEVKNSHPDAT